MELEQIVSRIAELIPIIDKETNEQNHNQRNKRPYVKGVATLREPQLTKEIVNNWSSKFKDELSVIDDEISYPDKKAEKCDLVLTDAKEDIPFGKFEWAIEIKYLRLVGNNGNNNDYVMQKAISPFLKDRSLIHDIEKLNNATFGKRKAIIFYGFDYDDESESHAEIMCQKIRESIGESTFYVEEPSNSWFKKNEKTGHIDNLFLTKDLNPTPKNLGRVVRSENKHGSSYSLDSVTEVIDAFISMNEITSGGPYVSHFSGLERHPCAKFGRVVGWEIK